MKLPENDYQILRLTDAFYQHTHSFAYLFKKSIRSKTHRSGLDYTKILIVTKTEYLDNKDAIIDKDEYIETIIKFDKIKQDALEYVEGYVAHMNKSNILHPALFKRKYGFSTLKYFHNELGLTKQGFGFVS